MKKIVIAVALIASANCFGCCKDYANEQLKIAQHDMCMHIENFDEEHIEQYVKTYCYLCGKIDAYRDIRDKD